MNTFCISNLVAFQDGPQTGADLYKEAVKCLHKDNMWKTFMTWKATLGNALNSYTPVWMTKFEMSYAAEGGSISGFANAFEQESAAFDLEASSAAMLSKGDAEDKRAFAASVAILRSRLNGDAEADLERAQQENEPLFERERPVAADVEKIFDATVDDCKSINKFGGWGHAPKGRSPEYKCYSVFFLGAVYGELFKGVTSNYHPTGRLNNQLSDVKVVHNKDWMEGVLKQPNKARDKMSSSLERASPRLRKAKTLAALQQSLERLSEEIDELAN